MMASNSMTMKSLFQGVDYRVARTRGELEKAYRLVYQEYLKQGYVNEHPSRMRFSLHNALPEAATFLALVDDFVTATATVIPDSPLGLPMDELYHRELDELRLGNKKICEVSMLANTSELFGDHVPLMLNAKKMFLVFFLFKHIFDYVRMEQGSDYICITVNPKHANTYDSLFFQDLGGLKQYHKVNGAPAVAKYLDVRAVQDRCSSSGRQGLYKLFLSGQADPEKFKNRVRLLPEDIRFFFVDQVNLFKDALPAHVEYIKACYAQYDFSTIIS